MNPVGSSLSAVTAFQKKMDVTANNIANVKTDEFKKSRVTLNEGDNGGVKAQVQQVDTPGMPNETIHNDTIVEVESSNVDLTEEITEMIPTQAGYNANMKTIQVQDEMLGSLMDLIG